ncbi:DUF418 domain-containing protein [Salisediminibacterium beveridgei]|uniref:DUF418 domain-containing protein n=1 Tax=Salisediminibacterium beveridgei TaxID=632773 RepID=A0A1D7QX43_9BACI|nr:DUF418 domain-containing protein [Salisediminibacterium beveridgei]AOM83587.1 hypothetical protein BBEV_2229 [Salisediminibacterium beveridgei]
MNRLHYIDSLRGFSLFGILLVNMLGFQYGIDNQQQLSFTGTLDSTVYFLIQLLFQGSFYPVFAILFGIGGALMYERAQMGDASFFKTYTRRLLILLGIGLFHWVILWHGDILIDYALTGLILMLLIHLNPSKLLLWIAGCFSFVAVLGLSLIGVGSGWMNQGTERAILLNGDYLELVVFRINELSIDPLIIIQILGLFLVGAVLVKSGWIQDVASCRRQWLMIALFGLIVGLAAKLPGILSDDGAITYYSYMFGGPIFGIGIIAFFILLYHRFNGGGIFLWLTYPGRTALTNYLTQSVIMGFIFYGYGLGQFEQMGMVGGSTLVVLLFAAQVMISKLWLSVFTMGPVEWLWRMGTYLKHRNIKIARR